LRLPTEKALLACLALSGCAVPPAPGDQAAPAAACCASMGEIRFRDLPPGQELEFSLTPSGATYDFSGQRRPFIALKLPDGFTPSTIQVRSYLPGFYYGVKTTAVLPEFVYLGSDLRVIGSAPSQGFQSGGGFWRSAVTGRVAVPPETRYMLVTAGNGSASFPLVDGRLFTIGPAASGDFSLRLFGESGK